MKTRLQTLLFCILVYAMVGCQKEGYFVPQDNEDTGEEDVIKVEILGTDVSELETAGPQTVLRMDGYTIVELYDPNGDGKSGTIVLLYEKEQRCALISYTESSLVWYGIDPQNGTPSEEFFAANAEKMMRGKMDWSTGIVSDAKYFDMPSIQTKGVQTRAGDGFNFARRGILDNILAQLKNFTGYVGDATTIMPPDASPDASYLSIVLDAIIIHEECSMITDEMEREEYRKGQELRLMWRLLKTAPAKLFSAFSLGFGITTGQEDVTNDDVAYYSSMFSRSSRYIQEQGNWVNMPGSRLFEMNASQAYAVTKNSAKIKGSYIFKGGNQGASIFQKGILWAKKGPGFPENGIYIAAPKEVTSWETTITGLEEATTYQACAYLSSMSGGAYYSTPFITFTTKGLRLAVSPVEINCSAKGNSKGIYVDTNDNAEWTIVSKPSWCSIRTKDVGEYSFFVDIKENTSTEQRNGEITVQSTVIYEDGTQEPPLTATIAIAQEGKEEEEEPIVGTSNFSNTKWNINSGTVKMTITDSEGTETDIDALEPGVLTFGEICANKVEVDGFNLEDYFQSAGAQFSMVSSTDAKLVLRVNVRVMGTVAVADYTFERTSPNTMSGIISVKSSNGSVRGSITIEFTGILIR